MKRTINFLREFSIPLIAGVFVALAWANIDSHGYHEFIHKELIFGQSFHFLINDIFMVFFFAMAGVEIVQSLLPGGDLNPIKKAINPLFATAGGVLGPVAVYFILNHFIGGPELTNGWGIPTATDIALAWLVAKFVFGGSHPAVKFLLLLAIADDAIGLIIIAVFYPDPLHPVAPIWLLLVVGAMLIAFVLNKMKVKSYWPYLLIAGIMSWTGLHNAHLHPALALVVIVPFLPHKERETEHLFEGNDVEDSTLVHFEHQWSPFVDFGLFLFGVSNAGVEFSGMGAATWIVLFALLIGKSAGVFIFGNVAQRIGFPLPDGMGEKELFTAGLVAALGLTVALFVAGSAFTDPGLQGAAKMGALFSVIAAPVALIAGKMFRIKKIN